MPHKWDSFIHTADEWIINYSMPMMSLVGVKLFSVGHAFELCLKAANTKITGDIDRAIKFGHDIPAIWHDNEKRDSHFLPQHELRKTILKRDLLSPTDYQKLSKKDFREFITHQEIYVAAKYLADLKYLGAPLKKVKGAYGISMMFPNPIWSDLFRDLRTYLGIPGKGKTSFIQLTIDHEDLPAPTKGFLLDITGGQ
jgi:hypothetical protein